MIYKSVLEQSPIPLGEIGLIRYAFVWFNLNFLDPIAFLEKLSKFKSYIKHPDLNLALILRLTQAQLSLVFVDELLDVHLEKHSNEYSDEHLDRNSDKKYHKA